MLLREHPQLSRCKTYGDLLRFSEQQIAFALRQAESGTPVSEVVRKMGITERTYYLYGRLSRCKQNWL